MARFLRDLMDSLNGRRPQCRRLLLSVFQARTADDIMGSRCQSRLWHSGRCQWVRKLRG